MIGTLRHTDLDVAAAVLDAILNATPAVLPITQMAVTSALGATGVEVVEPTRFVPGGLFQFFDGLGEESIKIDPDWDGASSPIPLLFSGLGYPGLQRVHQAGMPVGTNAFTDTPTEIDYLLSNYSPGQLTSWPLVWVTVTSERGYTASFSNIEPDYQVMVNYRLRLIQPKGVGPDPTTPMDPNQWSERIWKRGRADCNTITAALMASWHLEDSAGESTAIGFGDEATTTGQVYQKDWTQVVVGQDDLQFSARATYPVRGEWLELGL